MLEALASRPDPFIYLVLGFPIIVLALAAGYWFAHRFHHEEDDRSEAAFGIGQASIFGLIALLIGFSFAFAADRFEARRAIVVHEADVIGTLYLRADFLSAAKLPVFKKTLIDYTTLRLRAYDNVGNPAIEADALARANALQHHMWLMASEASAGAPQNLNFSLLVQAVNDTIDVAEEQTAALNNHVPAAIVGIVMLCAVAGAALVGLTFGRARRPNVTLSIIFCVLVSATVFTIMDLDHAQGGFIRLDTTPLHAALDEMQV